MSLPSSGVPLVYDCLACGRCCFHGANHVQLFAEDLVTLGPARVHAMVVKSTLAPAELRPGEDGSELYMRNHEGHCIALDPVPGRWACTVYEDRPLLCRVYEPGSPACLKARGESSQSTADRAKAKPEASIG